MSTRFVPVVPHSLLESLEVSLRSSGVVEVEYVRVNHSKSGTAMLHWTNCTAILSTPQQMVVFHILHTDEEVKPLLGVT